MSGKKISVNVELDPELYQACLSFIEAHKGWDQDKLVAAATRMLLASHGHPGAGDNLAYLDTIFVDEPSSEVAR